MEPKCKMAIMGETGSGKTTLLKIIAGRDQADGGHVFFEGERVPGTDEKLLPGHDGIAYLSQGFELPHYLRVEQVLEYADTGSVDAANLFEICEIAHLLKRRTDQLSGGEQQRVALAQRLLSAPRLLLLDEPFSNLDRIHKERMKTVLERIGHHLHITCLLVSHDPLDAFSWADEMLLMKEGAIVQQGAPQIIYNRPVNEYVAALSGAYNLLLPAQAKVFGIETNKAHVLIRPEQFVLASKEKGIAAQIEAIHFMGHYYELQLALADMKIKMVVKNKNVVRGETVYVSTLPQQAWCF